MQICTMTGEENAAPIEMSHLKKVIKIIHRSFNCTLEVRDSENLVSYQGLRFPLSQMSLLGENI